MRRGGFCFVNNVNLTHSAQCKSILTMFTDFENKFPNLYLRNLSLQTAQTVTRLRIFQVKLGATPGFWCKQIKRAPSILPHCQDMFQLQTICNERCSWKSIAICSDISNSAKDNPIKGSQMTRHHPYFNSTQPAVVGSLQHRYSLHSVQKPASWLQAQILFWQLKNLQKIIESSRLKWPDTVTFSKQSTSIALKNPCYMLRLLQCIAQLPAKQFWDVWSKS